jgi:hypothetical protein
MEVVVKRISEGRILGNRPSHSLLEGEYTRERSSRNECKGGVARVESVEVATRNFVCPPGTTGTGDYPVADPFPIAT